MVDDVLHWASCGLLVSHSPVDESETRLTPSPQLGKRSSKAIEGRNALRIRPSRDATCRGVCRIVSCVALRQARQPELPWTSPP